MNKEKVYIDGYEVGFRFDPLGTKEKIIQVASGETVIIDENLIYKSIEREKATIPQFVADWIEYCKRHNFTLFGCLDPVDGFERLVDENFEGDARKCIRWCRSASDKLARAWLDGYEVEKEEKRYLVKIKGLLQERCYLNYNPGGVWLIYNQDNFDGYRAHHTRKELEDAGFGLVFDCDGVEVQEVE